MWTVTWQLWKCRCWRVVVDSCISLGNSVVLCNVNFLEEHWFWLNAWWVVCLIVLIVHNSQYRFPWWYVMSCSTMVLLHIAASLRLSLNWMVSYSFSWICAQSIFQLLYRTRILDSSLIEHNDCSVVTSVLAGKHRKL